jgi:hypothetical protein
MAAVLYTLTGAGGPWAQDPPYYAEVVAFETGEEMDRAHIRLTGWRGWQQDRWIYFYHNGGPVVVVDEARGPAGAVAAFIWHLNNAKTVGESRFRLGTREIMIIDETRSLRLEIFDNNALTDIVALGQSRLKIVAVFLMR